MKIGVLAAQGAFEEHIHTLKHLDVETVEVRLPEQLSGLDGLIIPGGESTSITRLIVDFKLRDTLKSMAEGGFPIFGTCAGMIMLGRIDPDPRVLPLEVMNIKVLRNAFGRQVDSFEADVPMPVLGEESFHAVFIRAPQIQRVGKGVEVLGKLTNGTVVAARQGKLLVTSFHPELTDDLRVHRYFLKIVSGG